MKHIIPLLLSILLTACGGGGGGGSSAASASVSATSTLNKVVDLSNQSAVRNMAVGDLNNDGLDDIVIGGWSGPGSSTGLIVLIQNADGTLTNRTTEFLPVTTYSGSQHIFIRDLDNDGRNDIFIPGFNDGCPTGCSVQSIVFWNQTGQFVQQTLPEAIDSHGSCIDDINSDGFTDILVRSAYVSGQTTGGVYINNGNRTFTYSNAITAGATCSVNHEANGNITIFSGNGNYIRKYDSSLNLISETLIASQDSSANDGIDSISLDVNNDGVKDFIIVFNSTTDNTKGRREVWLNDGAGNYSYSYTIETGVYSYYHHNILNVSGATAIYVSGANLQARLYKLSNGVFTSYKQSRFTEMAQQAGYYSGFTWSVASGTVYQNSSTGKLYMLQLINSVVYTQEL